MKKRIKCIRRQAGMMMLAVFFALQSSMAAYATGIGSSQIATGTTKLIQDASTWLLVLAPIAAGMLIIYFCIRRAAADEMDQSAATRCCQ